MPIIIDFPGIPKGQKRPRFGRGLAYKDPESRAHEASLAWVAKLAMKGRPPLCGALAVSVDAYFPVPQSWSKRKRAAALLGEVRPTGKPDWENIAKVCDALNGIVWIDDARVVDGDIHKYYSITPSLHIEVTEI